MSVGGGGDNIGRATFELFLQMQGYRDQLAAAEAATQSATRNMAQTLGNIGANVSQIGRGFTAGFTLPIVAGVAAVIKAGSDYESAVAGIAKTTEASEEQIAALSDSIREMATDSIPLSREELARLGEVGGQLGVGIADMEKFIDTTARLGVATELAAEDAATGLARLLNIVDESISTVDRYGSVLVLLGNRFAATEGEILDFAQRLAPVLTNMDVSTPDVLGFAAALASLGLNSEAAGTAVGRLFINIADMVRDGGDHLKTLADITGKTKEEFATLFEADASAAVQLFIDGLRDLRDEGTDIIPILTQLELDEIRLRQATIALVGGNDLLRDSISAANGEFKANQELLRESERRFETFASQVQFVKSRLTDLLVEGFEQLRPTFIQLMDVFDQFIGVLESLVAAFSELPTSVQTTVLLLVGLLAVLGPIAIATGAVVSALAALGTVGGIVVGAIAGIAVATIVLIRHFDDIQGAAERLISWFEAEFPATGALMRAWADLVGALVGPLIHDFEAIQDAAVILATTIAQTFLGLGRVILGLIDVMTTASFGMVSILIGAKDAIVQQSFDPLVESVGQLGDNVVNGFKQMEQGVQEIVSGIGDGIEQWGDRNKEIFDRFNDEAFELVSNNPAEDIVRQWLDAADDMGEFTDMVFDFAKGLGVSDEQIESFAKHILSLKGEPQEVLNQLILFAVGIAQNFTGANLAIEDTADRIARLRGGEAAFEPMAEAVEDVISAVDEMNQIFGILYDRIESSRDAITHWEKNLSDTEEAIEITKRLIEETGDPTGELAKQLDSLTWFQARLTSGIKDGFEPAFAESVTTLAEFTRAAEELDRQLKEGDISPEKHAELMQDLKVAYQEAQDPAKELAGLQQEVADAFSAVIDKLNILMYNLGLLSAEEAQIEVESNVDRAQREVDELRHGVERIPSSAGLEIKSNAPEATTEINTYGEEVVSLPTEATTTVHAETQQADDNLSETMIATLELDGQEPTVTPVAQTTLSNEQLLEIKKLSDELDVADPELVVTADTLDTASKLDDVQFQLIELTNGTYLVTVGANVAPAFDALQQLRDGLPQSPAKEGPLAFTPDWTWLFTGLEAAANVYTKEALEHLTSFVNTAKSALGLFTDTIAFSRDALTFRLEGGRTPDEGFIGELAAFSDAVVQTVTESATKYDKELLEASQTYLQAASSSVSLLQSAVELLSSLGGTRIGQAELDQITALKQLTEHLVTSLGDSAALLAETRGAGFLGLAQAYSEAAISSVELIAAAADAFKELAKLSDEMLATGLDQRISAIKFMIEHLVTSMGDTAQMIGSQRGEGFIANLETFAVSATIAVDLLTSTAEALEALSETGETVVNQTNLDTLSQIKFIVEHIVRSLGDSAATFDEQFLEDLEVFASSAGIAVESMTTVLEFIGQLAESAGDLDLEQQTLDTAVQSLAAIALDIARAFQDVAKTWDTTIDEEIASLAEAVSSATGSLTETLDFLNAIREITDFSVLSSENIALIAFILSKLAKDIAKEFAEVAATWETGEDGSVGTEIAAFAEAVETSLGALSTVIDFLDLMAEDNPMPSASAVKQMAEDLALRAGQIADAFAQAADEWDGAVNPAMLKFSEAVDASAGSLGAVADFLLSADELGHAAASPSYAINLAENLSAAARGIAEAVALAAAEWQTEVNPQVEAFSQDVQNAVSAIMAVLDLVDAVTEEADEQTEERYGSGPNLNPGAGGGGAGTAGIPNFSPIIAAIKDLIGQVADVAASANQQGLSNVLLIVEAVRSILGLMDDLRDPAEFSAQQSEVFRAFVVTIFDNIDSLAQMMPDVIADATAFRDGALEVNALMLEGLSALAEVGVTETPEINAGDATANGGDTTLMALNQGSAVTVAGGAGTLMPTENNFYVGSQQVAQITMDEMGNRFVRSM